MYDYLLVPALEWLAVFQTAFLLVLACLCLWLAWRLHVQTLATKQAAERLAKLELEQEQTNGFR